MPIAARLSARDLHAVIDVVAVAAASQATEPFEPPVLERLAELIPADRTQYFELGLPGCTIVRLVADPRTEHGPQIAWAADDDAWTDYPLADYRRRGETRPFGLSDFLSRRELERAPFYVDRLRPAGIEHELRVWLPSRGSAHCFAFERGPGRDFDDRDRAVLTMLRPHLAKLRERWERRRRRLPLTPREADVLRLVARGLTNKEIASQLVLSSGTVRTHLENIFDKLGVHTRTAAAAVFHTTV